MPGTWTAVRVFLSSTFKDMQAERDHLVKVVFPALRERLAPHRVTLTEVDLRWGITREQADGGQALQLCLGQIDACKPFFLGLLGERYGGLARVTPRALRAHPWLADHPGRGITELEFVRGASGRPGEEAAALLCLRDPAATASVPEPLRSAAYADVDPDARRKLAALKARVRASGRSVLEYSCTWDPQQGKLVGLGAFGRAVHDHLWAALSERLGLAETPRAGSGGAWDDETDHHERFLESRLRVFVGREGPLASLLDFAAGTDDRVCLVSAPDGGGKTALLARFAEACRAALPDAVVLPHFAGAGPRSTSLPDLTDRLGEALRRRFGLEDETPGGADAASERFRDLLWRVPATARVVLVLDGLERLEGGPAGELYWLPERLPGHVKVVAACATHSAVDAAFRRRGPRVVAVGPLTDRERVAILRRVPSLAAKSLDRRQSRALLGNPATRNPLYLWAALEELRAFGVFEQFDQRVADLPVGENALHELFGQILTRLESDFGRELTARVLGLLLASRRGLAESELKALTEDLLGADDLFPLLRQLRPWLFDRGGLTDPAHRTLREAARRRYLNGEEREREAHLALADHFAARPPCPRAVGELPWHLARANAWERLHGVLSDLAFFDAAWQHAAPEIKGYWARLGERGWRLTDAYRSVVQRPTDYPPETLARVAHLLADTGHPAEARVLRRCLVAHYRTQGPPAHLAAALGNLALLQRSLGDVDDALSLYAEAENLCRTQGDRQGLQRVLGNRARLLKLLGDLDGAQCLLREQERLCRELGNRQGLQTALGNRALVARARGDTAGALSLLAEAERVCRESGNRHGLQITLSNRALLSSQEGDADAALLLLEEAEEICRDVGNRQGLQVALGHRATILQARGERAAAARLLAEQERICRDLGNRLGLQIALANRALILSADGDVAGALALLAESERLARSLRNPEGVVVALRHQAEVLAAAGERERAGVRAREALVTAEGSGLTALADWVRPLAC